jgi:uncharacterized phage protein gp47/JayE
MRRSLFVLASAIAVYAWAISPDEIVKHKKWMDDAQDLKEEIRDAASVKDSARAAIAAGQLVKICEQEVRFWTKTDQRVAQQLAKQNLAAALRTQAGAKSGDSAQLRSAFDGLESTCRACHDVHPEKSFHEKGDAP